MDQVLFDDVRQLLFSYCDSKTCARSSLSHIEAPEKVWSITESVDLTSARPEHDIHPISQLLGNSLVSLSIHEFQILNDLVQHVPACTRSLRRLTITNFTNANPQCHNLIANCIEHGITSLTLVLRETPLLNRRIQLPPPAILDRISRRNSLEELSFLGGQIWDDFSASVAWLGHFPCLKRLNLPITSDYFDTFDSTMPNLELIYLRDIVHRSADFIEISSKLQTRCPRLGLNIICRTPNQGLEVSILCPNRVDPLKDVHLAPFFTRRAQIQDVPLAPLLTHLSESKCRIPLHVDIITTFLNQSSLAGFADLIEAVCSGRFSHALPSLEQLVQSNKFNLADSIARVYGNDSRSASLLRSLGNALRSLGYSVMPMVLNMDLAIRIASEPKFYWHLSLLSDVEPELASSDDQSLQALPYLQHLEHLKNAMGLSVFRQIFCSAAASGNSACATLLQSGLFAVLHGVLRMISDFSGLPENNPTTVQVTPFLRASKGKRDHFFDFTNFLLFLEFCLLRGDKEHVLTHYIQLWDDNEYYSGCMLGALIWRTISASLSRTSNSMTNLKTVLRINLPNNIQPLFWSEWCTQNQTPCIFMLPPIVADEFAEIMSEVEADPYLNHLNQSGDILKPIVKKAPFTNQALLESWANHLSLLYARYGDAMVQQMPTQGELLELLVDLGVAIGRIDGSCAPVTTLVRMWNLLLRQSLKYVEDKSLALRKALESFLTRVCHLAAEFDAASMSNVLNELMHVASPCLEMRQLESIIFKAEKTGLQIFRTKLETQS